MAHPWSLAVNRSIGALLLIAGTTLSGAVVAGAVPAPPPVSGDTRAVAHPGNAVTCAEAGLTGGIISVTSTDDGTFITITAIPADTTVTGVVVKGGPAYNVYLPSSLGSLPWKNLHSPLNPSGGPAGISHWFVCGFEKPPTSTTTKTTTTTTTTHGTTTTTTKTTTKTTTSGTTTTTSAATTTTPSTVTSATTTTTTTTPLAVATTGKAGSNNLAFTGFGNNWLIVLAATLLLGGLGLALTPKLRTLLANRRR